MTRPTPPFGPFTPGQRKPTYFAMCADDCLLHFKEDELTPKQQEDHEANIVLTAMLQVAQTYMGNSQDHAAMHAEFTKSPWAEALAFYNAQFHTLFGDVISPASYHYFPRDGFYEAVANSPRPGDLLSLYMVSGSNLALHRSSDAWALSQRVNSKMHFAATAPAAGIPVPETLVCKKCELATEGAAFFDRHSGGAMLKVQGLAGARNVTAVQNLEEAQAYVADYDDALDVLLQQKLDTRSHTEMTVDLDVSDTNIRITNVRRILFADGLWVGNFISDTLELSTKQRETCLRVGEYVRDLGYSAPEGFNCGIDFFVHGDDISVIEINARWTGGLFPARLIERLGVGSEPCVAFIDVLSKSELPQYLDYISANVAADNQADKGFRFVPMGFSPFVQVMDDRERIYVWQVVVGDFERFKAHKNRVLGKQELPTADLIHV